jgi:hypothetical protein
MTKFDSTIKFDSTLAWREATTGIAANRDLLLATAGVFFALPWLAFLLLVPDPPLGKNPDSAMAAEAMVKVLVAWLQKVMPWFLGLSLVQSVGTMTVLALLRDRSRPTVGEAIRRAGLCLPSYIGAMLLFALAFSLVAIGVGLLATAIQAPAIGGVLINLAFIALNLRLVLVAPVIVMDHVRSPVIALSRSWKLTRGQALRILVFLLLLFLGSQVVLLVAGLVVGSVAALVAGEHVARIAEGVVEAGLMAVMLLYLSGVLAAIHRQLAAPAPADDRPLFG